MLERLISTFLTGRRPRTLIALSSGMLAGSLLTAPTIGLSAATPVADQLRAVSCWATGFHPTDSDTAYEVGGSQALYRTAGGSDFRCDVELPQRAVVTAVRFTEMDLTATGGVGICRLLRFSLAPPTASAKFVLASVPPTGFTQTPGIVRTTDTSINGAIIDNVNFAYALECDLTGTGPDAGLFGGSITYSISAANG